MIYLRIKIIIANQSDVENFNINIIAIAEFSKQHQNSDIYLRKAD